MHKKIAIVSGITRLLLLPNPFVKLGNVLLVNLLVAEPLLQIVSIGTVWLMTDKKSKKIVGTVMYLYVYWLLVLLLYVAKFQRWI